MVAAAAAVDIVAAAAPAVFLFIDIATAATRRVGTRSRPVGVAADIHMTIMIAVIFLAVAFLVLVALLVVFAGSHQCHGGTSKRLHGRSDLLGVGLGLFLRRR